jgi:hypothetical protein
MIELRYKRWTSRSHRRSARANPSESTSMKARRLATPLRATSSAATGCRYGVGLLELHADGLEVAFQAAQASAQTK